jgi:hypothetical protein
MSQRVVRVWLWKRADPNRRTWAVLKVPADATAEEIRQAAVAAQATGASKNWEAEFEDAGPGAVLDAVVSRREGRLCFGYVEEEA